MGPAWRSAVLPVLAPPCPVCVEPPPVTLWGALERALPWKSRDGFSLQLRWGMRARAQGSVPPDCSVALASDPVMPLAVPSSRVGPGIKARGPMLAPWPGWGEVRLPLSFTLQFLRRRRWGEGCGLPEPQHSCL